MTKDDPLSTGSTHPPSAITEAFFTHGNYSMQFEEAPENEPFLATPRPSTPQQPAQQRPMVPEVPGTARDHSYINTSVHIPMGESHIPYETLKDGKFLSRSMLVNSGGQDLYRFLVQRSMIQPKIVIKLQGMITLTAVVIVAI